MGFDRGHQHIRVAGALIIDFVGDNDLVLRLLQFDHFAELGRLPRAVHERNDAPLRRCRASRRRLARGHRLQGDTYACLSDGPDLIARRRSLADARRPEGASRSLGGHGFLSLDVAGRADRRRARSSGHRRGDDRLAAREWRQDALKISHIAYPDRQFDTPSGKIEFYSARAAEAGLPPLPVHDGPPRPAAGDYPLALCQGRTLAQFHAFYDHGQALPMLAERDAGAQLWISPGDASGRELSEGDAIRVFNRRGAFAAKAHITDRIPPGVVWMRDGCIGLNQVTSGAAALPEEALGRFHFTVGQAAYEAMVEVEAA